jgi:glycosyltransferase involved in cell wall biosynthesis
VPEKNPNALAKAIARTLDDPEGANARVAAARAKVEAEFDAAREARKLLKFFADVSA